MLRWGEGPGRRVGEMEAELERMRSRQDTMRRRLRKHTETKTKLEVYTVHAVGYRSELENCVL